MPARKPSSGDPHETPAAQQQRLENTMWTARMRRGRQPSWHPPAGPTRQEREARERERLSAAEKVQQDRDFNMLLYAGAAAFTLISIICVVSGAWMATVDPAAHPYVKVEYAPYFGTAGLIGCLLIVPVFMLAHYFRRR